MMAQKEARAELRRARRDVSLQHLVRGAERVFAERGYDAARMQDVARESGLALATVYDLVASKEDLYAEIYRSRGSALLGKAAGALGQARTALDLLLLGIAAYVGFLCEHPDYLRIQLGERQPWALLPRFHAEEQQRLWQQGLDLTISSFRAAIAEGSIIPEDPEVLARLMIAAHQVYLGRWVEQGMSEPVCDLIARMQRHVLRAFGSAPPPINEDPDARSVARADRRPL